MGRDDRGRGLGRARRCLGLGRRRQIIFAGRGKRPIDLRLDQNVVWAADHDEMLDVVAPHQHKLPLPVEAERVHKTQSRLSRPSPWDAQPVGEHESVQNRQNHQRGKAAGHQESDLHHAVVGEWKIT
ncbi:MAG: hypothetical protein JO312_08020 [Hyphomicrobiales bacterium]|nr:hypothetical protein [Hyphomicrobiales bacterium]